MLTGFLLKQKMQNPWKRWNLLSNLNSFRKTNWKIGWNERVWRTTRRINKAERKYCLRLVELIWVLENLFIFYFFFFCFGCLLSLLVSSFIRDTRKVAFSLPSLLNYILNFCVFINESKSTFVTNHFLSTFYWCKMGVFFVFISFNLKIDFLYFDGF